MIKLIALLVFGFVSSRIFAAPPSQALDLSTARGTHIRLDIYNPGEGKILILGQGQGCSPRLDLYEAIAAQARGFTLARIYWSYCVAGVGGASEDLSLEAEDFMTALSHFRKTYSDSSIYIGGKSLGSFVSADIFLKNSELAALVLLTPVCTNQKSKANEFSGNYPGLALETRPVLLAQGNMDPLCDTNQFQEFVKTLPKNFIPAVFMGDHSLGIKNSDQSYDAPMGLRNLQALAKWIFTWL
jgi:predicted esterase